MIAKHGDSLVAKIRLRTVGSALISGGGPIARVRPSCKTWMRSLKREYQGHSMLDQQDAAIKIGADVCTT